MLMVLVQGPGELCRALSEGLVVVAGRELHAGGAEDFGPVPLTRHPAPRREAWQFLAAQRLAARSPQSYRCAPQFNLCRTLT